MSLPGGGVPGSGDGAGRGARPDLGPQPDLDVELRGGFAALRRQEEAAAPSFGTFAKRGAKRAAERAAARRRARDPRAHGRRLPPLAIAAATAAVACAALVVVTSPWLGTHAPLGGTSVRPKPSITAWRPATDFLLRTPGREILAGPPAFGSYSAIGIALDPGRHGAPGGPAADRRDIQRRP
ncbi:MAG TPA: hypothetical protein VE075_04545 [Thermoanaerobaculia bacterium]|nr:hypothetical protein [Thermoanaerobaculia bacterium]